MITNIDSILRSFSTVRVLVIGDVILDRYWWGGVTRISPEAPVPVVSLERTSLVAGGAANVAANIAGLGAVPFLLGISGDDAEAELLPGVLAEANITKFRLLPVETRRTAMKTRVIAHNQQVVRIDQESTEPIDPAIEDQIIEELGQLFDTNDIAVVSDYGKGFLTARVLRSVIELGRSKGKMVLVDPKGKDYTKYAGATMLTPNQHETANACGVEDNDSNPIEIATRHLLDGLSLDALLVTQGEHGMTLLKKNDEPTRLTATARRVYDVTGAGDTVVASIAAAMGGGLSFAEAAELANLAAGLVVERVGTTAVTAAMIAEHIPHE